jgi:hypothetical protein
MKNNLNKIVLIAIAVNFTLSMAFVDIPSENCMEEIITLSKGNGFNMQAFMSNLPPAVAKAKLQAKAPFGKPKDSDKTDIGITFGCLKAFPESPSEIAFLLKDISQKTTNDAVTNQFYATGQETPQVQTQPKYPPSGQHQYQQAQVSQYPPPQAQYQDPLPQIQPQYPPPQVFYIYLPQQVQQTQCKQEESENFSTGQRWGTWFLNTVFPGLGSAVVMNDYVGMGIQMGLTGLGIIVVLNWTEEVCYGWSSYGGDYDCRQGPTSAAFGSFLILLGSSAIYNIIRSYSYNEPPNNHASNNHNGFNLAVMPNRHGEVMPYLLYNKTF